MSFHTITHNAKYRFATLHNFGCMFRCPVCSYKLHSGPEGRPGYAWPKPDGFLTTEQIKEALRTVDLATLYFMGGEPTMARNLAELLGFGKNTLGVRTFLGHCNGWKLDLPNLDGANVGLKAWDPQVHRAYTGREKELIFGNFQRAFEAGMDLKANVVYVPGLVDVDQVEAIAAWLGSLSRDIRFHIMGYIPVPGQPYERPTAEQMTEAVACCQRHLNQVGMSHLTSEEARNHAVRDDRFAVKQIA
ncbi:MAG: radical SAM protein [Verrucomicrobiota bacterium]